MCLLDERYVKFTESDMEIESVAIKSGTININTSDCDTSWEEWE